VESGVFAALAGAAANRHRGKALRGSSNVKHERPASARPQEAPPCP
jgi:hypothetical protein